MFHARTIRGNGKKTKGEREQKKNSRSPTLGLIRDFTSVSRPHCFGIADCFSFYAFVFYFSSLFCVLWLFLFKYLNFRSVRDNGTFVERFVREESVPVHVRTSRAPMAE